MRLTVLCTLLALAIGLSVGAQKNFSLNGAWHFRLATNRAEAASLERFHVPEYPTTSFKSIPVPSNWAIQGFEEPVYRGFDGDTASEGFYVKDFTTPADYRKKRILLHFGGVWSSAEVWLNGQYLGRHMGGYTSFSFDVSGKLSDNGTNRLAVRVKQVNEDYKFDVYDDWTLGGIYRDVYLEAMPKNRWLDKVTVQTVFDNDFEDAVLHVKTMVNDRNKDSLPGNYPSPGKPYDLVFRLLNKEGKEILSRQVRIPAHIATGREVAQQLQVQKPRHWNAEHPYLYTLEVELLEEGKVSHVRTERIGFRQVSTKGGVFRINGQAVKLRGVNLHDEHPDVGRATTPAHWAKDIRMMKEANINYIRLSHYAHAKGFIELCDESGIYVGGEVSLGGAGELIMNPAYSGSVLQRSYETVARDINSPSIIYWSIGNEDALTTAHMTSVKLVKALDPTRPVLLPWRHETWLPEEIDILAPHYWQPSEYDELAAKSDRPIISTEYTHAFGQDGLGSLESRWKALTRHPSGTGAAIWMWADQGIRTTVPKAKNVKGDLAPEDSLMRLDAAGWDGIVDANRNFTRDYFETKAVYAQVYPLVENITFTPGEKWVSIPIKNEYDFTNLQDIKIEWSVFEDEKALASGSATIVAEPHATGILKLPVESLKTYHYGKTCFIWLRFLDKAGIEINKKAVELCTQNPGLAPAPTYHSLVVTEGETTSIKAGAVTYTFDPKTGQLVRATLKQQSIITGLNPSIWKKLDRGETSVIGSKIAPKSPDLNKYTPRVEQWNVVNSRDHVVINARVKYTINQDNRFTTIYKYTISSEGRLNVYYEITPEIGLPSIPAVGMAMNFVPELGNIRWLGLGPYDAYPNKKSAPLLGVWSGKPGEQSAAGNKSARWVERWGPVGNVRVSGVSYIRNDRLNPETTYLLSGVIGRPEKGRKPEEPELLLSTGDGHSFVGSFSIELNEK